MDISARTPLRRLPFGAPSRRMEYARRVPNCPYLEDLVCGEDLAFRFQFEIEFTVAGQRGNFTQLPP